MYAWNIGLLNDVFHAVLVFIVHAAGGAIIDNVAIT